MNLIQTLRNWIQDRLLRQVVRNSSYLFVSNAISAVLSIVTANLLGVAGFGVLGIVIGFCSNVNRLLSFRMGDLVVKYMGEAMAQEQPRRAAAVVKAAMLVESVTSLIAYGVLVLLAPLGALYIVKDPTTEPLIMLYGLSLLANFSTETATGVLQVTNHYRSQALINLILSLVTAGLIIWAFFIQAGLLAVLVAYLVGKMIIGLGPIAVSLYWLPRVLGRGWWKAPFSLLPARRELAGFAISTNFSGTINVIARDSEVLWVGYFFSPLEAGYYKTALAIINLVIMPITPFISTTYPEITRYVARGVWTRLRRLLGQVTAIAGSWTILVAIGLLLFGDVILFSAWQPIFGRVIQIYPEEFLPALPILFILLIGFGTANTLFWNRPLLLAFGKPGYPLKIAFWAMAAKVALAFWLVPRFGYWMEAVLLSAYFVISVGLIVWEGMREIRKAEKCRGEEMPSCA